MTTSKQCALSSIDTVGNVLLYGEGIKLATAGFGFFERRAVVSMAEETSAVMDVVPNSSPLRAHIEENIAQTRKGINSSINFKLHAAKSAQISGGYLVDE